MPIFNRGVLLQVGVGYFRLGWVTSVGNLGPAAVGYFGVGYFWVTHIMG